MREYRGKRIDGEGWAYGNLIRMKSAVKYGNNEVFSNCWIMRIEEELNVRAFSSNGVWVGSIRG
ncbi:hypothetical protein [Paenibacillus sp. GXUN7292]|uniref:hypothetical protein n=1 Tax=Paenibacillus sp. GXUN7292 TaxID=3422499 RepID=UPI003D7EA4EC